MVADFRDREAVYRYEARIGNHGGPVYKKKKRVPKPNLPPSDDPGWITVPGDPNFPPEPKPDPRDANVIRATRVQKTNLYKRFPKPNLPPLDDPRWITVPGDPNFPLEPKPDPRDANVIRATRVQKTNLYRRFPIGSRSQRVLLLHPSDGTERVRCSMKVMAIEGQTPVQGYDALSYRWGKVHTDQFVWLEGAPVRVSDNLYAALFNLRKSGPGRVRRIWVDQLCINQEEDAEISRIIPKQHMIYKQADQVIVWLGQSTPESDIAIQYFSTLFTERSSDAELHASYLRNNDKWTCIGPGLLSGREWWNRVWIVQEVMLARRPILRCGQKSILFDTFLRIMSFAWKNNIRLYPDRKGAAPQVGHDIYRPSLMQFWDFRQKMKAGAQPRICEWLVRFYQQECEKDRDHVYGFLGLASAKFLSGIDTDVQLHSNDVFLNATLAILQKLKALDFICLGHGPNRRSNSSQAPYLPSWVPDLAANTERLARPLPLNYFPDKAFNASAGRPPYAFAWSGPERRTLFLQGFEFDKVRDTTGVNKHDEAWYKAMFNSTRSPVETVHETFMPSALDMTGKILDEFDARYVPSPYAGSENGKAQAFWRTIVCDLRPSGQRQDAGFEGLKRIMQSKDEPDDFQRGQDDYTRTLSWQWVRNQEKYWWTNGRKFMTTEKGYVGIAPWDAEKGDSIFVVDGASVPYLMRRKGREDWKLIGEW
jgi:hypothetical protein